MAKSRFGPKDKRSNAAKVQKHNVGVLSYAEQAQLLQTVNESLNKDFGEGTVSTLGDFNGAGDYDFQISTGSIGLDIACGPVSVDDQGAIHTGVPNSRMMEVFGPESSGKTTLVWHMIANAQHKPKSKHLLAGMIDVEHAADKNYARDGIGVDIDKLQFAQPSSGDESMEILDRWLRSNQFSIIAVDSVAALLTTNEMEGNISDTYVGEQARLMSKALKKFSNYLGGSSGCPTVIVFVNQIREKVGVMFGNPETTPGGRALKFYSHIRLDVRKRGNVEDPETGLPAGQTVNVTCIKNKVVSPYRSAEFILWWGNGIDRTIELAELSAEYNVVMRSGAWYKNEALGLSANGLANFVGLIRGDKRGVGVPLYIGVMSAVLAQRGINPDGSYMEDFVRPEPNIQADDFDSMYLQENPDALEMTGVPL